MLTKQSYLRVQLVAIVEFLNMHERYGIDRYWKHCKDFLVMLAQMLNIRFHFWTLKQQLTKQSRLHLVAVLELLDMIFKADLLILHGSFLYCTYFSLS